MMEGVILNKRRKFEPSGKDKWVVESHRLPIGVSHGKAYSKGKYIYLFGGEAHDTGLPTDNILFTTYSEDGTLAPWQTHTVRLPYDISTSSIVVYDDRVYLLGGWSEGGTYRGHRDTVISCSFSPEGEMGEWRTETTKMTSPLGRFATVLVDDVIWTIGGWDGWATYIKAQYSKIQSDGTLSNWTVDLTPPPINTYNGAAVRSGKYIYLFTGNQIHRREILNNGNMGPWSSAFLGLDHSPINPNFIQLANTLYVTSYWDSKSAKSSNGEFFFNVATDGKIDETKWSLYPEALPIPAHDSTLTITDNKILIIGGTTLDIDKAQVYSSEPTVGFDYRVNGYSNLPKNSTGMSLGKKYLVYNDEKNNNRWTVYIVSKISGASYNLEVYSQSVPILPTTWTEMPTTGYSLTVNKYSDLPKSVDGTLNIPPGYEEDYCWFSPMPAWCSDYTWDTSIVGKVYLVKENENNFNKWTIYKATAVSGGYVNWTIVSKAEQITIGSELKNGSFVLSARLLFSDDISGGTDGGFNKPTLTAATGGPGSLTFVDFDKYENSGFLGEVTSTQLITGNLLAETVSYTTGISVNSDVVWLKFYIDGKVLFIPKKCTRHSVSMASLMANNLVTGERTILIKGHTFKLRLIHGLNENSLHGVTVPLSDSIHTHRSEWNRLMYRSVVDNPTFPKTSQTRPNWISYPQDNSATGLNLVSGNGHITLCNEINPRNRTFSIVRGGNGVTALDRVALGDTSASNGWRPVLELV